MRAKRILVWFRNDLRLHDNQMLVEAIAKSDEILPVYIFDPRHFESTTLRSPKSGAIRTQFLLESVGGLRASFQQLSGDLLILSGHPEVLLPALVEEYDIAEVFHHREVASEETQVSADVEEQLWKIQVNLRHFIGHTLYNKEDLPFPIKDIPDVFAQFKKKTERDAIVKACFLAPEVINFVPVLEWGALPLLNSLVELHDDVPSQSLCIGGEAAGIKHLKDLLKANSPIYIKPSKTASLRTAFSSKLSAWLSVGCLSPRMVYWLIKDAEDMHGANPYFNQMLMGLLWRDYFRFMFKKHGPNFFDEFAIKPLHQGSEENEQVLLEQWKAGETGNQLVDKYMQELNSTGFIPHHARLLLATYLIYVLKIDWVNGASYFEEKSIDYAPANNWCNWAIVAGGGMNSGAKKGAFDLDKQFKILNVPLPELAG